ncbi:MAG: ferritin [Myxococcota bacterium]|jgi:ferritin|nr:ferritin [Myxococcota bacterium]
MLKEELQKALNEQINAELFSSYLYLSMAAYFEDLGLAGFASWMKVQAQEELLHSGKFYTFINERRGRVQLLPIEGPQLEWESPLAAFKAAFEHECYISERIHKLVSLARKHEDYPTENFLQWFVAEQVEEEATADGIVQRLKLIGDNSGGVFMLDRELGARTFALPAAGAED